MPDNHREAHAADSVTHAGRLRRRWRRYLVAISLAVLAFLALWFITVRVTSGARRIRIFTDGVSARGETSHEQQLTMVTWNIAHGRGSTYSNFEGGDLAVREGRLGRMATVLRTLSPDIVVLNEVDFDSFWSGGVNQAAYLATEIPFPYRMEQRNIDLAVPGMALRFGNAILSRFPIVDAVPVEYPGYAAWETIIGGKKGGVVCTIAPPGGQLIRLVPIHLDYRGESQPLASVRHLLDVMKDDLGVILAGDFNSTRPNYPFGGADAKGPTAISVLEATGHWTTFPSITGAPADCTFPSTAPDRVIDWIFVPRGWTITDYRVIPTDLSDHNLVVAQLAR